jgi:hypothetical protein
LRLRPFAGENFRAAIKSFRLQNTINLPQKCKAAKKAVTNFAKIFKTDYFTKK